MCHCQQVEGDVNSTVCTAVTNDCYKSHMIGDGWEAAHANGLILYYAPKGDNEETDNDVDSDDSRDPSLEMWSSSAEQEFTPRQLNELMEMECLPTTDVVERYDYCAVVGNSGVLLEDERFGAAIDSHDAVFRFNDGPIHGFGKYVGTKTTYRAVNNNWTRYLLDKPRARLAQMLASSSVITFGPR